MFITLKHSNLTTAIEYFTLKAFQQHCCFHLNIKINEAPTAFIYKPRL